METYAMDSKTTEHNIGMVKPIPLHHISMGTGWISQISTNFFDFLAEDKNVFEHHYSVEIKYVKKLLF